MPRFAGELDVVVRVARTLPRDYTSLGCLLPPVCHELLLTGKDAARARRSSFAPLLN